MVDASDTSRATMRFVPKWLTVADRPLTDTAAPEGSVLAIQLRAVDSGVVIVANRSRYEIVLTGGNAGITRVLINNVTVSPSLYGVIDNVLSINASVLSLLGDTTEITVERDGISFTLLTGQLPNGVTLTPTGYLTGLVQNIPDGITEFAFAVRITNGKTVQDRTFVIAASGQTVGRTIVLNSLPPRHTDTTGAFDYYPLGAVSRAEGFLATFDVTFPDGNEQLAFSPIGQTVRDSITGVPPGIELVGTTLRGTIAANAPSGRYLARVGISGETQMGSSVIVELRVLDQLAGYVERPLVIEWQTPQGSLGVTKEGYPAPFGVRALHSGGGVFYALAPGSQSLPTGMRINPLNGDIEGVTPHVERNTDFGFTVRATRAGNFVDRPFFFTVENLYTTAAVLDVRLKLRNVDQTPMLARYRALTDEQTLYRPDDPSFGMPVDPFIYLIKGVSAAPFAAALSGNDANAISRAKDYHGPVDLVLGRHDYAVVRDQAGDIVYEVVYRTLFDPQAKAGGFSFTADQAIEQPVIHAQSQKIVYALSLRNARLDLIRDCRFPSSDPTQTLGGSTSVESMPAWMTSPQIAGDPSSVLGYIPAVVIAYVLPGTADALVASLNGDSAIAPVGRQVVLDRYYLYSISYETPTTFDGSSTTVDGNIVFDTGVKNKEDSVAV